MFASVCILLGLVAAASAFSVADEHNLIVNLMKDYDPYVHPHDANDAVDVHFDFEVTRVVDFDLEHQVLTVDAIVAQEWHDAGLEWDLEANNNVHYVNLPLEKIWHPDIVAIDSAGEFDDLFDGRVKAHIDNKGHVTYVPPVEYHFYCHTDKEHAQPGDDFDCAIEFTSWKYAKEDMDVHFMTQSEKQLHQLDGDFFHADFNREWSISNVTTERFEHEYACCPGEHFPILKYHLIMHHNDHCHE